jgi:hypothetical protein
MQRMSPPMAEKMPKQPPPPPAYLSEVPSRSYAAGGTYKHHRHLGHAKNAILATGSWSYGYREGTIYKWNSETNEWELVFHVSAGTKHADLPWVEKED